MDGNTIITTLESLLKGRKDNEYTLGYESAVEYVKSKVAERVDSPDYKFWMAEIIADLYVKKLDNVMSTVFNVGYESGLNNSIRILKEYIEGRRCAYCSGKNMKDGLCLECGV